MRFGVHGDGGERIQSGIEFEPGAAMGAMDFALKADLQIDVRMIPRRGTAGAFEFPHANANSRKVAVIAELRVDRAVWRRTGYADHRDGPHTNLRQDNGHPSPAFPA